MERRGRRYVILLRRMYGCTYYCRRMIVLNGRESIMAAAFTKMNQKEIGDIESITGEKQMTIEAWVEQNAAGFH